MGGRLEEGGLASSLETSTHLQSSAYPPLWLFQKENTSSTRGHSFSHPG